MEKYYLWDSNVPFYDESFKLEKPFLTPFIAKNESGEKTGCVIVCPGGAYCGLADHEGNPVSQYLQTNGISAFTLTYRCKPYDHRAIISDINRAVRWVRYNAQRFNIDPDKIGVLGFSAGGNLALLGATQFDYGLQSGDDIDRVSSRPDAALLCYPVISMKDSLTHDETKYVLVGRSEEKEALAEKYSGENAVKEDTPPMFIWHTAADTCVKVENSIVMAQALAEHKIPFELHIFPEGEHGLGLAENFDGGANAWPSLAVSWLSRLGF